MPIMFLALSRGDLLCMYTNKDDCLEFFIFYLKIILETHR